MNNLIIFSHPNPKSFSKGILDRVIEISKSKNIETKVRDLYKLDFDPVLKPVDFEKFQSGTPSKDILEEQKMIKWADLITIIHPIWWAGAPAIFKGYIDRVFSYGFAYEYGETGAKGLLKDKKVLIINTTGAPNEMYKDMGMHKAITMTNDFGIFQFCGMEIKDHLFLGAVPYVGKEVREQYLKDLENYF